MGPSGACRPGLASELGPHQGARPGHTGMAQAPMFSCPGGGSTPSSYHGTHSCIGAPVQVFGSITLQNSEQQPSADAQSGTAAWLAQNRP